MYRCVHCASSIDTGMLCTSCLTSQKSSVFLVLHCNFCGAAMKGQHGTECAECEASRMTRLTRIVVRVSRVKVVAEIPQQPTLWAS
jgi:hypothetical protein